MAPAMAVFVPGAEMRRIVRPNIRAADHTGEGHQRYDYQRDRAHDTFPRLTSAHPDTEGVRLETNGR